VLTTAVPRLARTSGAVTCRSMPRSHCEGVSAGASPGWLDPPETWYSYGTLSCYICSVHVSSPLLLSQHDLIGHFGHASGQRRVHGTSLLCHSLIELLECVRVADVACWSYGEHILVAIIGQASTEPGVVRMIGHGHLARARCLGSFSKELDLIWRQRLQLLLKEVCDALTALEDALRHEHSMLSRPGIGSCPLLLDAVASCNVAIKAAAACLVQGDCLEALARS